MECHVSNAGWEIASYNKSYMSTDVSNTKEIKDKGKKTNAEKKLLSFFRHLTNVGTPPFFFVLSSASVCVFPLARYRMETIFSWLW